MKRYFSALFVAALSTFALTAQTTQNNALSPVDRTFLTTAMTAGMQEVADAAPERQSSNSFVRDFAIHVVQDHEKVNSQLLALATKDEVPIPTQPAPSQMVPADQYMTAQVTAHTQAVSLFQGEADQGSADDLKTIAGQALPALKTHLTMAQQFVQTGKITPVPMPT